MFSQFSALDARAEATAPSKALSPPSTSPPSISGANTLSPRQDAADRKKLLDDLYKQLNTAEDAKSADLIAKAIEKLWLLSGSDTVDLLMERALIAIQKEDFDLALELLAFVTKIAPDFTEGWNKRAMIHYMKREYTLTMRELRQVLARDPKHFKAIHGLGLLLKELGNKKSALKAMRKAIEVHPFLGSAKEHEKELSREVEGQGI